MRNVGKPNLQRDVGYPRCAVARFSQQRKSFLQPHFGDVLGQGRACRFEQALQIAGDMPWSPATAATLSSGSWKWAAT